MDLTDIHESYGEYYYLARSSLPHLLSHPTDWEAHGRYWRPSEHLWGFSSSSQVILLASMTAICVFVQMIKFWFPQKSQYQFQLMLRQSMAEKLMIFAVWQFSPKFSLQDFFLVIYMHIAHTQAIGIDTPKITLKLGSLSNLNQRTN